MRHTLFRSLDRSASTSEDVSSPEGIVPVSSGPDGAVCPRIPYLAPTASRVSDRGLVGVTCGGRFRRCGQETAAQSRSCARFVMKPSHSRGCRPSQISTWGVSVPSDVAIDYFPRNLGHPVALLCALPTESPASTRHDLTIKFDNNRKRKCGSTHKVSAVARVEPFPPRRSRQTGRPT